MKRRDVFVVDFALKLTKLWEKYLYEHFHHVRIDGDLVDKAANHAIHCATIFKLLRNNQTVVLAISPILHRHLKISDFICHSRKTALIGVQ